MHGLEVTAAELEELANNIREGTALALKISAELAGHPQWKGRTLDEAAPDLEAETPHRD